MNPSQTPTKIEKYDFSKQGLEKLRFESVHPDDWPVVYILHGAIEAYIGETQNLYTRMDQHLKNKDKNRKNLTIINVLQNDTFNKSAILDIENMLIDHMHADGKFILQNKNGGQSKFHNYYQRADYKQLFENIWEQLLQKGIVQNKLYEVENSEIFKFSPFKQLTSEQYDTVQFLLTTLVSALDGTNRTDALIKGGAGTGKSMIAIYFLYTIATILSNNYDYSDLKNTEDEEDIPEKVNLIKKLDELNNKNKKIKIGFVVPVPAFRDTIKKVFRQIKELKIIDVLGPSEVVKEDDYDILIVDEAHRLKRRNKLTNYGVFDECCQKLGLGSDKEDYKKITELDWIKAKAKKLLILFYDTKQSVKESDIDTKDIEMMAIKNPNCKLKELTTQLRVKGGNEYIEFVKNIFNENPKIYIANSQNYDVKVFDKFEDMYNMIKEKNKEKHGLCRVFSSFCFNYTPTARAHGKDKNDPFKIEGKNYYWSPTYQVLDYITNEEKVDDKGFKYGDYIGCVYHCQGHDLNYAGVIFGEEIYYDKVEKKIKFKLENFKDKNAIDTNNDLKTIQNIINAYLVMLTRGVYGTYIYAIDPDLREYLHSLIQQNK